MFGIGLFNELLGKVYDNVVWEHRNDKQFAQSQQLAEEQYQRQLDFWNQQNSYNSPSRQVRRLRQAGLNPSMLNGSNVSNTAGGLSSMSTPSAPSPGSPEPLNFSSAMQDIGNALVADKQAGFLTQQTKNLAQEFINLQFEKQIKEAAAKLGYTNAQIRDMERDAYYQSLYGKPYYSNNPVVNNPFEESLNETRERINLIQEQQATERSKQRNLDAITTTENYLRELTHDQLEQNIAESKALVAKLNAEEKKILRETDDISQIVNRRAIVDCASAMYGFPVHDLPPTLQQRLMDNYAKVVRGEIFEDTAIRSANRAIEEYRNKELHIPRTRSHSVSRNYKTPVVGESSQNAWSETY